MASIYHNYPDPSFCPGSAGGGAWPPLATPMPPALLAMFLITSPTDRLGCFVKEVLIGQTE